MSAVRRQNMDASTSSSLNSDHGTRLQFSVSDLIGIVTLTALLLVLIGFAQTSRNVWLIQASMLALGIAFWLPACRRPTFTRLHWFCVFATWWILISHIATFAIWQSAFAREDFWIPQLMAFSDVGYVLYRFLILPVSLIVLIIGIIDFRRRSTWVTLMRTFMGVLPLMALVTMETIGLIQW